jgi:hypothetical protein
MLISSILQLLLTSGPLVDQDSYSTLSEAALARVEGLSNSKHVSRVKSVRVTTHEEPNEQIPLRSANIAARCTLHQDISVSRRNLLLFTVHDTVPFDMHAPRHVVGCTCRAIYLWTYSMNV